MAPRLAARPARENDFSDVGKIGRRTGVVLPQGRLDVNGMEEMSGIFSSPRKPSPLKYSMTVMESVEDQENSMTPRQALSARKSIPPRSASPRKSGISGSARRSKIMDPLSRGNDDEGEADEGRTPTSIPATRMFDAPSYIGSKSLTKTPILRSDVQTLQTASNDSRSTGRSSVARSKEIQHEESTVSSPGPAPESIQGKAQDHSAINNTTIQMPEVTAEQDDYVLPAIDDEDDGVSILQQEHDDAPESEPLQPLYDDEDADETFQPQVMSKPRSREPTVANSRRKRKSDAVEHDIEIEAVSSPAAKRAKRISDEGGRKTTRGRTATPEAPDSVKQTMAKPRGRPRGPLKSKDTNTKMSTQQESEVNEMIEKIKARPGQKKSLYILRRETPADDGVTHTRSGRVSVKPLAYWRNEKCVFGGSPGGANLQIGTRFPLNSIKEIIRTDEVVNNLPKQAKKSSKSKGKMKARSRSAEPVESESDSEQEGETVDPDADPWETEVGTFRGRVQVWDTDQQTAIDEQQEVDIAYANAAMETREVKGSSFKYAKLLSTRFLGSGIVELPPGGVKRPKNSRKMHMSFFVATGRVTVQVGPINGPESRFSIGKGGFWQVPRGNQYSIENEHGKTAKIFFSQACEAALMEYEE